MNLYRAIVIILTSAVLSGNPILIFSQDNKIDINTASAENLQKLPRVGTKTAGLIIEYRDTHGPFFKIDELLKVYGINKNFLEENRGTLEAAFNYECPYCRKIFSVRPYVREGKCPYCNNSWPKKVAEKKAGTKFSTSKEEELSSATAEELKIRIGDYTSTVKRIYGEPLKIEGPSSVAKLSPTENRARKTLSYKNIAFEMYYDKVYEVCAGEAFNGTIKRVAIGARKESVTAKLGEPDETVGGSLIYRFNDKEEISFKIDKGKNVVTGITLTDMKARSRRRERSAKGIGKYR